MASAANPTYFKSYEIMVRDVKQQFIGGNVIAENPALYTFMLCSEVLGVPSELINVITVGGEQSDNKKLSSTANPIDWLTRFFSLLGPIKKYT